MINGLTVYEDFLPDPAATRALALASKFEDWRGPDGEVYRRICRMEIPGLRAAIERAMGPVDMLGMGFRLNFLGELPNAAVHSDIGWGTHALVLYLCDGPGGTAFWRHQGTGAHRLEPGDVEMLAKVEHDWNDLSSWDMRHMISLKFNRALIYESALFHSRWPFPAFGTNAETGRLVAVSFFTPKEP